MLLEGGPTLAGSFLDAGEVDELRLFVAPLVLGGAAARPLVAGRAPPGSPTRAGPHDGMGALGRGPLSAPA